jgi:hypothetical protein
MKYICLIVAVVCAFIGAKFDWVFTGNEAIAATKQVLTGSDYAIGRTTQSIWQTAHSALFFIAGFSGCAGAYLFAKDALTKKPKQTEQ